MSDHPDTDLTDPHGEAEALRREISRLRVEIAEATDPEFIWGAMDNVHDCDTTMDDYAATVSRAQRAALAAIRAPNPVANAGSCQTGDTIRQLLERHEAEMRAKGRNPLDYTSKWKQAADVVASLPAASMADAKPIEDKIIARAEEIEKEARHG